MRPGVLFGIAHRQRSWFTPDGRCPGQDWRGARASGRRSRRDRDRDSRLSAIPAGGRITEKNAPPEAGQHLGGFMGDPSGSALLNPALRDNPRTGALRESGRGDGEILDDPATAHSAVPHTGTRAFSGSASACLRTVQGCIGMSGTVQSAVCATAQSQPAFWGSLAIDANS